MKCTLSTHPLREPTREKGVYGKDQRLAVTEDLLKQFETQKNEKDIMFAQQARATCVLVYAPRLRKRGDHYELRTKLYHQENDLCESEKFYDHPAIGFCTGIAFEKGNEHYILTAGHCARDMSPSQIAFVWDYRQGEKGDFPSIIPAEKVVFPEASNKPFAYNFTEDKQDYAIFKCATTPPNSIPYSMFDIEDRIQKDNQVYMIGHPCGILQISDVGKVLDDPKKEFFRTNLSAYHGNSGSPVCDGETAKIVGILVRGDKDFKFDPKGFCYKSNVCHEDGDGCRGEDCVSTSYIMKHTFEAHTPRQVASEKSTWAPSNCTACSV